ncbi:YALI0C23540p [Yarrowia lipolytica CLIB122]|uniref:YALI0C23540p n=2 Tax=Yarrowia lipolytica TaxID=4952 RepID=Q6CAX6_YARLI|nr:YALI0C23540p [Yarrowia lipolytica CLIB122]AOW03312.1 hypothetical protein YALI1_C32483g [Yarrowia lipolytica]KAB8280158.1 hypothetical protein BKA91DRAFT_142403 [Yarrowia lipolytica]KAE8170233.1 hypothetical protein BKA90DRAFT_141177 [Yarrowia lipolytica]KAJ8053794.1 hypothetical protein LXG23DRAFT_55372 [Yarrowia lipolytica]RMI96241.1 hypothetical protein BD777DRAFT_128967 [Yarrowia lipolytica]|eukprot:XP_502186.2 YALI0C23540p [Yarrowia lipolytica CLIB122]
MADSDQVLAQRKKSENLQFWGLISISVSFLCGFFCAVFSRDEHNLMPTVAFAQLLLYCFSASQLDNNDNVFLIFAHVPFFVLFEIYVNWWFGGWHAIWVTVGLVLLYRSKSISKKLPHRKLRDIAKLNQPVSTTKTK